MKRMYILLSLMIVASGLFAQDYYWYRNQKIFLEQGDEQYVLFRPSTKSGFDTSAYIKTGVANDTSLMWGIQKRNVPIKSDIKYVSPSFFIREDSSNMYVTERFYVKLKQKEDYDMLAQYATQHNVTIVEEGALSLWYVLSCTEQSQGNALYMANKFYESSLFAVAEPEFINSVRFTCLNEQNFNQQWNLLNTGQQDSNYVGLDINYCDAHSITTGDNSMIIAVVDGGISYHLDLAVLYYAGYDAPTSSTPAQIYDEHGTKCAGIINAQIETGWGIAGVIPTSHLLPVSFDSYTPLRKIADGMKYAADFGVSVLSNSWMSYGRSNYLDSIINYVQTEGRDGKGCVVVFSAGNNNENSLVYPANSNPDIIAVGAMNPSAERANYSDWGSCYGTGLDIVAPGVYIPTTAPYEYIGTFVSNFSGTSAACPHIAGVAGLVLSINPNLTQKEVADIIESTAQKVGDYDYDSIARNGTWDYEMGYGLVDAYAAVKKAQLSLIEIEGAKYLCDTGYYYVRNVPENAAISWHFDRGGNILYDTIGAVNLDSVLIGKIGPVPHPHFDSIIYKGVPEESFPGHLTPPYAILSVTVNKDGLSYTKEKKIYPKSWGGPKFASGESSQQWPVNTARLFTITNCDEVEDESHLIWTASRPTSTGTEIMAQYTGYWFFYTLDFEGPCDITATNIENSCNNQSTTQSYIGIPSNKAANKSPVKTSLGEEEQIPEARKILREGQLLIQHNEKTYNAEGVKLR